MILKIYRPRPAIEDKNFWSEWHRWLIARNLTGLTELLLMVLERIKLWFRFLEPSKTDQIMQEQKSKADLKEAVINVALSSLVPAVGALLLFAIIGLFFGSIANSLFGSISSEMGGVLGGALGLGLIVFGIIYAVMIIVLEPIVLLVGQGISFLIAKLLGGKGKYTEQVYFSSFVTSAWNIVFPLLVIPCLGSILSIIIAVYSIYLNYKIIKTVHQLDRLRAAAVVLIPIAVVLAIYAFLFIASMASYSY